MSGDKYRFTFALVTDTSSGHKRIHKYPGKEQCNLDDAQKSGHRSLRAKSFSEKVMHYIDVLGYDLCEHCFPDGVPGFKLSYGD